MGAPRISIRVLLVFTVFTPVLLIIGGPHYRDYGFEASSSNAGLADLYDVSTKREQTEPVYCQ